MRELLFLIPVPHGRSVSWLCSEAAQRHLQAVGLLPHMALQKDGALLAPDDLVADVLQSGDEVLAEVQSWDLPPLPERYRRACDSMGTAPHPIALQATRLQAQSPTFDVGGLSLPPPHLPPLLRALKLQGGLKELRLRGCALGDPHGPEIGAALKALPHLTLLDLRGNRLGVAALGHIAEAGEGGAFQCLSELELSVNPLTDASCRPLALLLGCCPALAALTLRGCGFGSGFGTQCRLWLGHELRGATQLRLLSLSYNAIGTAGLEQLLLCVPDGVTRLEVAAIAGRRPLGLTALCDFLRQERCAVSHLTVAANGLNGCGVTQLIEAALLWGRLRSVDASANGALSAVGLRALQAALGGRPHALRHLNLAGCSLQLPPDDAVWAQLGAAVEELRIHGAARWGGGGEGKGRVVTGGVS